MPVGDLLVSVRASSQAYSNDIKSIKASTRELTTTTDQISASWGKSGEAADQAISKMNRIAQQKAVIQEFKGVTDGIVKSFASAGGAAEEAGKKTGDSMRDATLAAHELGNVLGVHIPRALVHLAAESKALGPILSGAFSGVALLGFIQVAEQIPELFKKINEAVTGWDKESQKAFERQKGLAEEHLDLLRDIQLQIIANKEALGQIGSVQAAREEANVARERLQREQTFLANLQKELQQRKELIAIIKSSPEGAVPLGAAMTERGRSIEVITKAIEEQQKKVDQLALAYQRVEEIRGRAAATQEEKKRVEDEIAGQDKLAQRAKEAADEAKKIADERAKMAKDYADFWLKALEDFRNRGAQGGEAVAEGLRAADAQAKAIIKDMEDLHKLEQDAGDELIKNQKYWADQLEKFRIGPEGVRDQVKAGEEAANETAKKIIKANEDANKEIERRYKETFRDLKDAAGHVFDLMIQGDISGIFKTVSLTWARDLYSTMIANFLTPFKTAIDRALAGTSGKGLLGSITESLSGIGSALKNSFKDLLGGLISGGITSAISAGIGKLVDVVTGAFGKGRKEADRFVQAIQNPFGESVGNLFKSLQQAQNLGKLTVDQVTEARANLNGMWAEFQDAAAKAKYNVGKQALDFFNPLVDAWQDSLDKMVEAAKKQEIVKQAEDIFKKISEPAGFAVQPLNDALDVLSEWGVSVAGLISGIGDDVLKAGDALLKAQREVGQFDWLQIPANVKALYDIANAQRKLATINEELSGTVRDAVYWQKQYGDAVKDSADRYESLTQQRKSLEQQIRDTTTKVEQSRLQGIIDTTSDLATYYRAQKDLADFNQRIKDEQLKADQDSLAQMQAQLQDVIRQQGEAEAAYAAASVAAQAAIEAEKQRIAVLEQERTALEQFFATIQTAGRTLADIMAILQANPGIIPTYQEGTSYVPRTGLAFLHQGEAVIPANKNGDMSIYAPISVTINGPGDPDAIATQIRREIQTLGKMPPTRQLGVRSNRY